MKKDILKFVVLLLVAIGAGPATSQVYKWSQTAGANANADPHINWAEGQAPSSINDSARAMMAALANYRNDLAGANITGGTSTAYTLASNQGFTSTTDLDGVELAFVILSDNGANPTLNVDGVGAFPLVSAASAPIPAGALLSGTVQTATFSKSLGVWKVKGVIANTFNIPLGGLLPYTGTTVPNANFIFPSGQCISTTTYAAYWAMMGSPASGGCPGGQFAVIDLRGRTLAALDNLNGSAASRLTSASTGCGTAMTSVGAVCANGVEGFATTLAQLPAGIISNGSVSSITVSLPGAGKFGYTSNGDMTPVSLGPGSTVGVYSPANTWVFANSITGGSGSASVTSNNTSGGNHPTVQPTIAVNYLLRVI
jgi:hypothetical protein